MKNYPMLEKMKAITNESQICGQFLEWLQTKYFMISHEERFNEAYVSVGFSSFINIEKLLAEYFDIDLEEAEREKRELLDQIK